MGIFAGRVCEHVRPALQDSVEEGLERLHQDLIRVFLHNVVLFFSVFSHLYLLLWQRRSQYVRVVPAEDGNGEQPTGHSDGQEFEKRVVLLRRDC